MTPFATAPGTAPEGLAARIARRIRAEGPLTVAGFMAMALHDKDDGYYAGAGPIGDAGDFITAPEISQVFGELVGLWCADLWQRSGSPDRVVLAELGPGRGVLMADFLRAAARVPGFLAAARLCLVETSPTLRAEQRARLAASTGLAAAPIWVERFDEIPAGPLLLVANEFLDALPVRQFVRGPEGWAERMVALDAQGRLVFAAGRPSAAARLLVDEAWRDLPPGTLVELAPAAAALAGAVAARLAQAPGAALFIDYGYFPSAPGASLRALSRHRPTDPLAEPGRADLSAHVDFAAFATAARAAGAQVCGPAPQGAFLDALGARARADALARRASPAQRHANETGLARLLDAEAMGTLFKAVAVLSPGYPDPAGFGDCARSGSRE